MSSWLILTDRNIQKYFLLIFGISLSLGCFRFLFPFQLVNIGGDVSLISIASSIFSIGQIIGFLVLCKIISSNTHRFLLGGVSILLITGSMSILSDPYFLTLIRIFDGLAYGFIFLGIIDLASASNFEKREGEVLGNLFAAVLSGLAVGQGVAGILWAIFSEFGIPAIQSIQIVSSLMFIITLILIIILYLTRDKGNESKSKSFSGWKWQHFHIKQGIRALFTVPAVLLLILIYIIYDFAHGIYTPNLSILLYQQGISEVGISLGYLVGDITWGISQIFTGRLVDKFGSSLPLIFSLLLKGIVVFFYPEISIILFLFLILFLAGLAEGFLEPARNKAVLELEAARGYSHSHKHLDLGFSGSGSVVLGIHNHTHEHDMQQETFVSWFHSIGIVAFGMGSFFGSLLLINDLSLSFVTSIGGVCLIGASVLSMIFAILTVRKQE
ncbi:MAG: MFS transporter [Candidatus Hodarchaeales archaeon]|jgi:MFS family permease